jgi:cytochrome c2
MSKLVKIKCEICKKQFLVAKLSEDDKEKGEKLPKTCQECQEFIY